MDAKKCDRCGNYYDDTISHPVVPCCEDRMKQINEIGNQYFSADMCQDCWDSFGDWWREEAENERL